MPRFLFCAFAAVLLSVLFPTGATAQVDPNVEQGMKPYGSYDGGAIGAVNLTNGNLIIHQPLWTAPQRGSTGFELDLIYNNKAFTGDREPQGCQGTGGLNGCTTTVDWEGTGVTIAEQHGFLGGCQSVPSNRLDPNGNPVDYSQCLVSMADGSVHTMEDTGNGYYEAIDGSGYRLNPSNNTAIDGRGFNGLNHFGVPLLVDPNGNQISPVGSTSWIDTFGRTIPQSTSAADVSLCPNLGYPFQPVTTATYYDLPGPAAPSGGTTPGLTRLILCGTQGQVRTGFFTASPYFVEYSAMRGFLQSIVLPDGTYWAFEYSLADPNNPSSIAYGDLIKVTLPTGGSISYTWGKQLFCTASAFVLPGSRMVLSRTVDANDRTPAQTWHYSWDSPAGENIVTDPLGNDTVHTMNMLGGGCSLYETQTDYYQGSHSSGQLLKTVKTQYSFISSPSDTSPTNPPPSAGVVPTKVTTVLPNGLTSEVDTDYDSGFTFRDPLYDNAQVVPMITATYTVTRGLPIAKREYDWGQGAPGALLRQTLTTYKWQVDGNYLTANMLSLPSSVKIEDGAGHLCAETDYAYDEGTPASSGIATQHTSSPGPVRGNLTTVTQWLSATPCQAGATWTQIASHTAYFDTGEVQSSSDPLGHTTTHLYDAAYAGAYPTQTCSPQTGAVQHCVSGAYDFNTGLVTSFTDENSQVSTFKYDNLRRITSAVYPIADSSGLHPETDFLYPDPLTVTRTKKLDTTGALIQDDAAFDGLGRTKQTTLHDPEGNDIVDTTYDALGRVSTVSNPHRATASSTDGFTTSYYDALGRVVQVAPQDGTLLPAGASPTTCQPNNICTDYSNFPIVTVTDQAGKLRRTRTDALGRLVEVDEPGPGANSAGTPASATINISGSLQSSTTPGTKATATVSVSGIEHSSTRNCLDTCEPVPRFYDTGTVRISANGAELDGSFGQGDLSSTVAARMVGSFGGITATYAGGSSVTLTANTPGPNYSFSTSSSNDDNVDFPSPSFNASPSAGSLTGGVYPVTTYDSGTLSVTVGGFTASASYNQNLNNTPQLLASALAAALNVSNSPVTAQPNGASITITAKIVGSAGEYAVTGGTSTSFTASSATLGNDTNPGGLFTPYQTFYSFDTLGNLTQVNQLGDGTQPARIRSFTYDSLGRLLTAQNPESGTMTYQYNNDGTMISKTDARGITTNYSPADAPIDALHRVLKKTYSNGDPAVTFTYDQGVNGIGHLTSEAVGTLSNSYGYDALGRIISQTDCLPSGCRTISVPTGGYNLASELLSLVYPDARNVTTTFNTAGRLTGVNLYQFNGTSENVNYYTVPQTTLPTTWGYFPTGVMNRGNYGNGLLETTGYNNRLQIASILGQTGATMFFNKTYGYYDSSSHNNGNVLTITDGLNSAKNQTYTYDQLNRLLTASESDGTFSVTYNIDAWGNMKESGTSNFVQAFDSSNRMSGWSYDAAGNLLNDGVHSYSFDAEGRIKSVDGTGATYTYGPDGQRVRKDTSSGSVEYVYFGSQMIAEFNPATSAWTDYIFAGGKRVAKDTSSNASGAQYYQGDHLGSTRIMTDASGTKISDCTYAPYGEQVACSPDNASNRYRYTGKERDSETGMDYFGELYT